MKNTRINKTNKQTTIRIPKSLIVDIIKSSNLIPKISYWEALKVQGYKPMPYDL